MPSAQVTWTASGAQRHLAVCGPGGRFTTYLCRDAGRIGMGRRACSAGDGPECARGSTHRVDELWRSDDADGGDDSF
jgi:hypothetical protein